jgi:hypothetical protein
VTKRLVKLEILNEQTPLLIEINRELSSTQEIEIEPQKEGWLYLKNNSPVWLYPKIKRKITHK